jgi:hypothetical protein
MKRRIKMGLKLRFIGLFIIISGFAFGQSATAPAFGDGSSDNPYQIASLENLTWLAADTNNYGFHYIQTSDIDASATGQGGDWGNEGWIPIGYLIDFESSDNRAFTGSYHGQDYKIQNLYVNRPESYSISLFGFTMGANLVHIHMENVQMTGKGGVGAIVGWHIGSQMVNCSSSGSINSTEMHAGGLAGANYMNSQIAYSNSSCDVQTSGEYAGGIVGDNGHNSELLYCYASGNVSGGNKIGGLSGENWEASVLNCYASGAITGAERVGGLLGTNNAGSTIQGSFAAGPVSGSSQVGGLVGLNKDGSLIKDSYAFQAVSGSIAVGGLVGYNWDSGIVNSYSRGYVTASDERGGLVGFATDASTVTASFWDMESSGVDSSMGGEGKSSAELQNVSTYTNAGWNFSSCWILQPSSHSGYPYLQWEDNPPVSIANSPKSQNQVHNFILRPIYPNPFNASFTVPFSLNEPLNVKITLYNINGQRVMEILNDELAAGEYHFQVNANKLSSGLYFVKSELGASTNSATGEIKSHTQKTVLIK